MVEQTGYPQEQVDLDADFEADLGIDSIKKAQMFGEIGEHFPIAAPSGNITLDDFPTLCHVLAYMIQNIGTESHVVQNGVNGHAHEHDRQPPVDFPTHTPTNGPANGMTSSLASGPAHGMATAVREAIAPAPVASASLTGMEAKELEAFLVNFIVEQTGYPPESVDIDADLEADLGIDSIKKAQMFGELGERFQLRPPLAISRWTISKRCGTCSNS